MLSTEEIARFRHNLDCNLDCKWRERDEDGSAWCRRCGSGFGPNARAWLAKLYRTELEMEE